MAEGNPEVMVKDVRPKIWQIILIGLIAIMFTSAWLLAYKYMNAAIWLNSYVETHPWTIPAGVIVFSVLVGLCRKYLHAPDVIHGGFTDSMTGDESHGADYRTFPGTLLSSFFSLFSGASIGPEGPLAFLVMEISAFVREKLKVLREASFGFDVAALASAYNGIIGNPLFTAVFATEFNVGKKNALTFLAWNLLAGVIGFLFYSLLGLHSFASFLPFPPITSITILYVVGAVLLGILGALIAILMGMAMKGIGAFMDRAFGDGIMTRVLFGGVVIALVCFFIPDLMFSGEETIAGIVENPAALGILVLLVFAVLKALLLALSFKSGFLGGPIFPTLFTCTMVGLALSLAFPQYPVGLFVMCIEVAVITLALGAPLTAILLIIVVGTANQYTMALLVVSSVVSLIIGVGIREIRAKREAAKPGLNVA